MSGGTKVFIGVVGAALLVLDPVLGLRSRSAPGPAGRARRGTQPRLNSGMGHGMGPHPMMGGSSAGPFEKDEPFDRQFIDRMVPHQPWR